MSKDKEVCLANQSRVFAQAPPLKSITFYGEEGRKATLDFSGEEVNTLDKITIEILRTMAPDLLAQIQKEAAEEAKAETQSEKATLQNQLTAMTENVNKVSEVFLKLDKAETIRQENDRKNAAERRNNLTAVYGGVGFVCDSAARCAGWIKSMSQIKLFEEFLESINQRVEYTGNKFKFCPWCGKTIFWEI